MFQISDQRSRGSLQLDVVILAGTHFTAMDRVVVLKVIE